MVGIAGTRGSSGRTVLLTVVDEPTRRALGEQLWQQGHNVVEANSLNEMDHVLGDGWVDLVLLDVILPDGMSFDHIARLGRDRSKGVIVVGTREEEVDRLISLELGADDFLVMPLNMREVGLRVRNLLRRLPESAVGPDLLTRRFDGWTLDLARRHLADPSGKTVRLTRSEFDLLAELSAHAGQVLDRNRLTTVVSNRSGSHEDRTIDVLIGRLRRKIEADPQDPRLILTIHGQGYRFAQLG
jgi:two-component system, OmpR family, torCAD operon response regulator TorR